jgi:hypothetical protein
VGDRGFSQLREINTLTLLFYEMTITLLQGRNIAKILLANYFFMPGTSIPAMSNLQNSINFNKGTTKFQDAQSVKECFANSISVAPTPG